jgi:hypothetical protein
MRCGSGSDGTDADTGVELAPIRYTVDVKKDKKIVSINFILFTFRTN